MKTKTVQGYWVQSGTIQEGKIFPELETGIMKMAIQYSGDNHTAKAQHFGEVK